MGTALQAATLLLHSLAQQYRAEVAAGIEASANNEETCVAICVRPVQAPGKTHGQARVDLFTNTEESKRRHRAMVEDGWTVFPLVGFRNREAEWTATTE